MFYDVGIISKCDLKGQSDKVGQLNRIPVHSHHTFTQWLHMTHADYSTHQNTTYIMTLALE